MALAGQIRRAPIPARQDPDSTPWLPQLRTHQEREGQLLGDDHLVAWLPGVLATSGPQVGIADAGTVLLLGGTRHLSLPRFSL